MLTKLHKSKMNSTLFFNPFQVVCMNVATRNLLVCLCSAVEAISNTFHSSTDSGRILWILARIHMNPTGIDRKSLYLGYILLLYFIYISWNRGIDKNCVYSKISPNQVVALNLCSSSVFYVDHLISRTSYDT